MKEVKEIINNIRKNFNQYLYEKKYFISSTMADLVMKLFERSISDALMNSMIDKQNEKKDNEESVLLEKYRFEEQKYL